MKCDGVYVIEDKWHNHLDVRAESTCNTIDGKPVIRLVVDTEKHMFTDDDICLIMGLLHKELDRGGSYSTMKDCVELLDKINEKNTINE